MEKEKVVSILKFYRDIDKTIRLNERVIKSLDSQYYCSVSAINMDGMPHGKGKTSSAVETTALNVPSYISKIINEIERENERLSIIKTEIMREIGSLNYTQKAVVLGFYIDGFQWERISGQIVYSPRQCRNIRDTALDRLAKKFSLNKSIAKFRFPDQ